MKTIIEMFIRYKQFKVIIFFVSLFPLGGCASFEAGSEPTQFVLYPLHFFRNTLSGADGDRCPMYPSCSAYSSEAIRKHGALIGWIMSSDRLVRCGRDELKTCPVVRINGQNHCYDPVSNNDFWW